MKWESANIGECADLISGPAFKSAHFTDHPDDIPLVKGENVQQSFVDWSIAKRWPRSDAAAYERFLLAPDDIVVAMDRPWVPAGLKWASISDADPQALLVQRIARLRATPSVCPKFLKYVIASPDFSDYVRNVMGGTNVPHISGDQIRKFTFPLPPISDQRSIGSTLAAYDDLIQNNRRRIALLEQSARLLYREWFMHLRFPGHEHVKVVDGVPEGWGRKLVSEIADINARSLQRGFHGEIEYIDIASVTTGSINETTSYLFSEAPGRARRIVRHGDLIWSCVRPNRASYAMIWNPAENLVASTGFCVLSPSAVPPAFLYFGLSTQDFIGYLTNNARGAAYPAVVAKDFETYQLLVPSAALLNEFQAYAEPIFEQMGVLKEQNSKLRQARDLLLPRLMRGDVTLMECLEET